VLAHATKLMAVAKIDTRLINIQTFLGDYKLLQFKL
jgi:hypothetical protein